jgi:ComF family protein
MEEQVVPGNRSAIADRLLAMGRSVLSAAIDIVYPPHCVGCGIMTGSHRGLCPDCWSSLGFIEEPYCAVLGIPFSHEQGAGALSALAIAEPPDFDRLRAVALHTGVARSLVHALKYRDRLDLAPMMALWMARAGAAVIERADLILPVPLHRSRLFGRRFNQSAELARAIASRTELRYAPSALIRVKRTERQVGLGQRARQENVRGAFRVTENGKTLVFGQHVLLVDDVYTTGATVNACARALKRAGAAEVSVLTFAMALSEPI